MNPSRLLTQPMTLSQVRTGTSRGRHGGKASTVTDVCVLGWFDGASPSEQVGDVDRFSLAGTVYLPPDVDVQATDRVTVGGMTFEVVGVPDTAFNPRTQVVTHVRATVRTWAGSA